MDLYDYRNIQRCEGYLQGFYGDALERTMNDNEYKHLNTYELEWTYPSRRTYNWCKAYLRKHSGSGGSRKRQSKRKALKALKYKRKALKSRKVSKKY
jgi:hypothetical protein